LNFWPDETTTKKKPAVPKTDPGSLEARKNIVIQGRNWKEVRTKAAPILPLLFVGARDECLTPQFPLARFELANRIEKKKSRNFFFLFAFGRAWGRVFTV